MTHHHHLPDDSIVFHSHVEIDEAHRIALIWWIGARYHRNAGPSEECRDRTCAMRRHDDG